MIPKFIVLLLSGGLDSVTLLYWLHAFGHEIHCVLFDYKQWHSQELTFAKIHCHRLRLLYTTIELPALGGLTEENWIVPNRNAILLSLAVNLAVKIKADTVTIGCNADDEAMFPDCRQSFINAMNHAVKQAGYDVEICAPFMCKRKWEIGGLARELGVKSSEIWSCYVGGAHPCGECPACLKLKEALAV